MGTGAVSDTEYGDGIVRIFSAPDGFSKASMCIPTSKKDVDSLSFCSRSRYLFVGETSDCSVSVYDLRHVGAHDRPIFETSHGFSGAEAVVPHVWLFDSSVLVTGGHDGAVRVWDARAGFSLMKEFQFNTSISCITASDADCNLWIGTDNGGVYFLSATGVVDPQHPVIISAVKGNF